MNCRACLALAWIIAVLGAACSTSGSNWINQPVHEPDEDFEDSDFEPPDESGRPRIDQERYRVRVIGADYESDEVRRYRVTGEKIQGRVLGLFRNTYYDFPAEGEFSGKPVPVHDPSCEVIDRVPRGFYEALCVQGSGILKSGRTVSFAKRDCECARLCPKTNQKICFNALDPKAYPWGRGALGKPITPLLTVAVDDNVVPMESAVYIPEYDGVPRDPAQTAFHDGCFVAQDRGMRVKGKHVDIFTGHSTVTLLWNRLVPSNKGVTVVLDSPRCARARVP